MLISSNPLSDRTTGAFPLSIATSLTFESLAKGTKPPYDPERVLPPMVNINDYQEMWINLHTLFRNIVGSVDGSISEKLLPGEIVDVLEAEIDLISDLLDELTKGLVKPVFYASQYKHLEKRHPFARLRTHKTEKQKTYHKLATDTIKGFLGVNSDKKHKLFDCNLTPEKKKKVLIVTNYAYDLLSQRKFEQLHLLESHTGILKKPASWYTKYSAKDLTRIPFRVMFMQLFGDSQTFFSDNITLRKSIIALSEKYKWTHASTNDLILYGLGQLTDISISALYTKILAEDQLF